MITNIINTIFISLGIALSSNNNANNFNIEQKHKTNANGEYTFTLQGSDLNRDNFDIIWSYVRQYGVDYGTNYPTNATLVLENNTTYQNAPYLRYGTSGAGYGNILGFYNTGIFNIEISSDWKTANANRTSVSSVTFTDENLYNLLVHDTPSSSSSNPSETTTTSGESTSPTEIKQINISNSFEKKSNYYYTNNHRLEKWILTNESNFNYINIQNTVYTETDQQTVEQTTTYYANEYAFFQINNYYDSQLTISLETIYQTISNNNNKQPMIYIKEGICPIIDLTLNDETLNQINNYKNTMQLISNNQSSYDSTNNSVTQYLSNYTIQALNTITICFYIQNTNNTNEYTEIYPNLLTITGTIIVPVMRQEIIDIPNIMFTVLTMPFAFISQGFNLTIFPNTQYQLNFTNLFMTILSIFILLWLLRKIIK